MPSTAPKNSTEKYRIAFDVERRRPGCVLLQAAMGGTVPGSMFYDLFPAETWLVGVGTLKCYVVTPEQLAQLAEIARLATTIAKEAEEGES